MRRSLALLLCVLLLLSGCAGEHAAGKGDTYQVYFAAGTAAGAAVESEARTLPAGADPAEGLMAALLSGPLSDELSSPFPEGVRFLSAQLDEAGALTVDLSERYGGLSGVDLTVADYCIALTLCQLPQVDTVTITVEGEPVLFRDRQDLQASDALLSGGEHDPYVLSAALYFPRRDGAGLSPETRQVTVSQHDSAVTAVLSALLEGPDGPDLTLSLPEGVKLRSARVVDGVCRADFTEAFLTERPGVEQAQLLLYAVVNSLCALERVDSVQLLVEGKAVPRYAGVDTSGPLAFDEGRVVPLSED